MRSRVMVKVVAFALMIAGGLGYAQRTSAVAGVRDTAQKLFDEKIEANALKVGHVDAPTLAGVPVIGQSTWRSHFFITDAKGEPVDLEKCPGTADYEVKFSDRQLLITVFAMHQLRECSRAIQKDG